MISRKVFGVGEQIEGVPRGVGIEIRCRGYMRVVDFCDSLGRVALNTFLFGIYWSDKSFGRCLL